MTKESTSKPKDSSFSSPANTLQGAWFLGHMVTLIASVAYPLTLDEQYYRLAYFSILESFGIIIYQHFFVQPVPKENKLTFKSLIQNENVLYFALALLWFFTPIIGTSLLPFTIFSFFHALSYMDNTFLPKVCGFTKENSKLLAKMSQLIANYKDRSMYWVANIELSILSDLFRRALLWYPGSWINLVLYTLFIKIRYENSKYMQSSCTQWKTRTDNIFNHRFVPTIAKQLYNSFQSIVIKLSHYQLSNPTTTNPTDHLKKGS